MFESATIRDKGKEKEVREIEADSDEDEDRIRRNVSTKNCGGKQCDT